MKLDKKNVGWYDEIGFLLRFLGFMQRYKIYRIFQHLPVWWVKFFSRFFGFLFLPRVPKIKKNIYSGLKILKPGLSEKLYNKYYLRILAYIAEMFYSMLFILPGINHDNIHKHITHKNFQLLDSALSYGKGVVIPSPHIHNITHFIAGLIFHPKKYEVVVIAEFAIIRMLKNLIARPELNPNVHLIGSRRFSDVKEKLLEHLRNNHIVFIFYDYTNRNQFRLPLTKNPPLNFLKPTPQSVASLHLETGAQILPGICYPEKNHSIVEFLPNDSIMDISKKYGKNKKQFHIMLGMEINRIIYPYIFRHIMIWEEIINFGSKMRTNYLRFHAGCTVKDFLIGASSRITDIIEGSYEPNRKDDEILSSVNKYLQKILSKLEFQDAILRDHKTKINFPPSCGKDEILKICSVVKKELNFKKEYSASKLLDELVQSISPMF
jgi:lauroyl/myristoyl acyltransferase